MTLPVDTSGRSSLLRTGVPGARAQTDYAKRSALVVGVLGLILLPIFAVSGRWMPVTGPGRLLYSLHDTIYLPVHSVVWTQIYPYGFVWLVPAAIFGAIALVEGLLPISVLRRVHRRSVLWTRQSDLARRTMVKVGRLGQSVGLRPQFAIETIVEAMVRERASVLSALQNGQAPDISLLAQDLEVLAALSAEPASHLAVRCLECAAFAVLSARNAETPLSLEPSSAAWRRPYRLAEVLEPDLAEGLALIASPQGAWHIKGAQTGTEISALLPDVLSCSMDGDSIEGAVDYAPDLAVLVLVAGLGSALSKSSAHEVFFDQWRVARLAKGSADAMPIAEALVAFSFWADLAESHSETKVQAGSKLTLLDEIVTQERISGQLGERFAERGRAS